MKAFNSICGLIALGLLLAACAAAPSGRPRADAAASGAGRSYTGEEIKRTGSTNVADGLALLDPRVTVQH